MDVHRFLITGTNEQLFAFHIPVCPVMNAVERRGQTVLYTCLDQFREMAIDVAGEAGVTLQEWDGHQWDVIVEGELIWKEGNPYA